MILNMMKNIQTFIIAPLKGNEFYRACNNIGGEFIQISPASKNCINVLQIRKVDKSVDELLDGPGVERSLLAAKIQRLHVFFSLLIPDMNHEERQLLDDALIRTYAKKGITHETPAQIPCRRGPGVPAHPHRLRQSKHSPPHRRGGQEPVGGHDL